MPRGLPLLLLLLSTLNPFGDAGLNRVRTSNRLTAEAATAAAQGRPEVAIRAYERLAELGPLPEEARLNLAHAYFRAGHLTRARATYATLSSSTTLRRRATALHQLGLVAAADLDYERALPLLRAALRAAPTEPALRASYEQLARWMAAGSQDQDDNPPPGGPGARRPQPRPGTTGQPQAAENRPDGPGTAPRGIGERAGGGDRPTSTGDRNQRVGQGAQSGNQRGLGPSAETNGGVPPTRPTGGTTAADEATRRVQTQRAPQPDATIPEAQARMILEAMQAAETQYLQQLPRRRAAPDPDRPDW